MRFFPAPFTLLLLISSHAFAQGALEPVDPPGPTMKTLDQVEPRMPLSEAGTISVPGSYYFTNNITGTITMATNSVTVDLSGYTLDGEENAGFVLDNFFDFTIRNGTVVHGTNLGAFVGSGSGKVLIEDVRVLDTGVCFNFPDPTGPIEVVRVICDGANAEGFRVFTSGGALPLWAAIRDSTFRNTDLDNVPRTAINIFSLSSGTSRVVITGNRIYDNPRGGIFVDGLTFGVGTGATHGTITDNHVFSNGLIGIQVLGDFLVARNLAMGNDTNYSLGDATNAAPVTTLGAASTGWENITD